MTEMSAPKSPARQSVASNFGTGSKPPENLARSEEPPASDAPASASARPDSPVARKRGNVKLTVVVDAETFDRFIEYAAEDHDCDVQAWAKYVLEDYAPPVEIVEEPR